MPKIFSMNGFSVENITEIEGIVQKVQKSPLIQHITKKYNGHTLRVVSYSPSKQLSNAFNSINLHYRNRCMFSRDSNVFTPKFSTALILFLDCFFKYLKYLNSHILKGKVSIIADMEYMLKWMITITKFSGCYDRSVQAKIRNAITKLQ